MAKSALQVRKGKFRKEILKKRSGTWCLQELKILSEPQSRFYQLLWPQSTNFFFERAALFATQHVETPLTCAPINPQMLLAAYWNSQSFVIVAIILKKQTKKTGLAGGEISVIVFSCSGGNEEGLLLHVSNSPSRLICEEARTTAGWNKTSCWCVCSSSFEPLRTFSQSFHSHGYCGAFRIHPRMMF